MTQVVADFLVFPSFAVFVELLRKRYLYHAFAFGKYGHCYLAEFQYRFNWRFRLRDMWPCLLRAIVLTAPWSESRLRLAAAQVC